MFLYVFYFVDKNIFICWYNQIQNYTLACDVMSQLGTWRFVRHTPARIRTHTHTCTHHTHTHARARAHTHTQTHRTIHSSVCLSFLVLLKLRNTLNKVSQLINKKFIQTLNILMLISESVSITVSQSASITFSQSASITVSQSASITVS